MLSRASVLLGLMLTACGPLTAPDLDAGVRPVQVVLPVPVANPGRDVLATALQVDVTSLAAKATLTLAASLTRGATLEVGDLQIQTVRADGVALPFARDGGLLDLALEESTQPVTVDFEYTLRHHDNSGLSTTGYTLLWPYYCGNLFPCHSGPADGTTFTLALSGVPAGSSAVYPSVIPSPAPSYQVAWSVDQYTQLDLGRTTAGTLVSVWYRPGEQAAAQAGTAHLVASFDWFERTLGPYSFGGHVGSVSVNWGAGAFGGMEHHPLWHIGSDAIGDEETNVHESAHGWFGDGVRYACWEDFVMSEGTVSYLAGRALELTAPAVGADVWANYELRLHALSGHEPVWPDSCGTVDVLRDRLFSEAPYMRGAFFFRAVALKVGAEPLDRALAQFYRRHANGAARMSDVLTSIRDVTGYDAAACANLWLRTNTIPAVGPCP